MGKGADQLELYTPGAYCCRVTASSIPKLIIIVRKLYIHCSIIIIIV